MTEDASTQSWWLHPQQYIRWDWIASVFAALIAVVAAVGGKSAVQSLVFDWLFWPIYQMFLSVIGVALGVALGLGFAAHVYDQLNAWHEQQHNPQEQNQQQQREVRPLRKSTGSSAAVLEDEQTYSSLLQSAGYLREAASANRLLRGQVVVRGDAPWLEECNYAFHGITGGPQHALAKMQEFWPTLPPPVLQELSSFMEYVIRDYVACWYKSVDEGCLYQDAAEVLKRRKEGKEEKETPQLSPHQRVMMYSLAVHRRSPFLDSLYESMAILFGNLATRVEHVNILHVVLLQWTRVLAHTFKVYRTLRKSVQHKEHRQARDASESSSTPVSEIAMTKEFLFCNKLHRAITFGLDVPALLFADASGKECGVPPDNQVGVEMEDDKVLEARLFDTELLTQCELDYNRVVAYRMIRALTPRQDFGSSIVSTLLTEVMAGCVLTPLMGCFGPDYLNNWIIKGLKKDETSDAGCEQDTAAPAEGDPEERAEAQTPETTLGPENAFDDDLLGTLEAVSEEENESSESIEVVSAPAKENKIDIQSSAAGGTSMSDFSEGLASLASAEGQPVNDTTSTTIEDSIISLLALALIEVQKHVDFEDVRVARENNHEVLVDWDDPGCRAAILRLVLVVELALTHGRCSYRLRPVKKAEEGSVDEIDSLAEEVAEDLEEDIDDSDRPVEVTLPEYESTTLSQILMEMTSDIDSFEERVATENTLAAEDNPHRYDDMIVEVYKPNPTEQSTLRTLIAAWLHTGQIFRTINVLVQAHATVLAPYYSNSAFLRSRAGARGFVRQLKALEGVEIMVDTMTVLACPRLDETDDEGLQALVRRSAMPSPKKRGLSSSTRSDETAVKTSFTASQRLASSSTTPRYLDFNRNESFAASLRSERERRMLSWQSIRLTDDEEGFTPVCRSKGASREDTMLHRELHHIARIFYTGTNLIGIRDAARRKNSKEGGEGASASESATVESEDVHLSLLTVETACPRRRIEVPDDDSSFLLRAQPRPLNAVGVHRDQRNHEQSFKCFAATYFERARNAGAERDAGGRYVRRCLIRYYPIDRTASVALQNDSRRLDQRKRVPGTITLEQSSRPTPVLSSEFLRERHLAQRWVPKGTARSQSILASSVIEPTDFTSMPRPGKAIDFVYKMSFFEKPMIDLAGEHFMVHDSTALGVHRTDASAMELSDASLSIALLMLGATVEEGDGGDGGSLQQGVQMGADGYPVVWMKFSRKQDDAHVEVKPYRTSFVRAALMVTAARQEAQLQCLTKCVRAGSAKKATKALTDAHLKPTLKLVEYAGNRSREKQSLLLRDLKLGVNHIDRDQLRRNGLLSPRYPTQLLELSATVEDATQTTDGGGDFFGASGTTYKIRCVAKVQLIVQDEALSGDIGYRQEDGSIGRLFREEWVVYRSFKEFQALHKHLKTQVAANMSSGTAGSRLVGAATAAFATTVSPQSRQRRSLVPSLSQASKAGALGVTKKSILRRKEILNGYIQYMVAPENLMRNCSELFLFLGAFYPLSPRARVGEIVPGDDDPLGRTEMSRSIIPVIAEKQEVKETEVEQDSSGLVSPSPRVRSTSVGSDVLQDDDAGEDGGENEARKNLRKIDMIPSIRAKIEKIPLSQVRNRLFELLRYQFGFENASFIRNRMLAALKTASFAVTSPSEFRRTLYKIHTEYLSGKAIAELIKFGSDLLWPEGVFFESAPPYTQEELDAQSSESKQVLHESFPEQVRSILGQELTKDGLDIFHEMLQNRVVVRSMSYMLFDLLWLEVFPEIGDVLQCGSALDIDK